LHFTWLSSEIPPKGGKKWEFHPEQHVLTSKKSSYSLELQQQCYNLSQRIYIQNVKTFVVQNFIYLPCCYKKLKICIFFGKCVLNKAFFCVHTKETYTCYSTRKDSIFKPNAIVCFSLVLYTKLIAYHIAFIWISPKLWSMRIPPKMMKGRSKNKFVRSYRKLHPVQRV
jgi:hypothetical protein